MPVFNTSYGDILSRAIKFLTSRSNIKQMVAGGKARTLLETFSKEISNVALLQHSNLKKAFLPTTSGQFLEHFGSTVGLTKYSQISASALAEDRIFKFYVRGGGTFGSINGGKGFTITKGTRLTAPANTVYEVSSLYGDQGEPDSVYDRSIHYTVTEDVPVASSDTQAFVSAESLTPGAEGNLAAPNMIRDHNFKGYQDYLGGTLLVTNVKTVLNGVNDETAASYRYRISKEVTSAEKANYTAILNAARVIPGVAEAVIIPFEDGTGRYNIFIKSISSTVSDKTITEVQNAIDKVESVGVVGYARKPYEVGIEIDSTLTFKSDYDAETKTSIRNSVKIAIIQYLNSLSLGQTLDIPSMVSEVKFVDSRIKTVGFNKTTFFDGVFVWYPSKISAGGKRRERLITDVLRVPVHARIIAETSISDPVRIY